MLASHCVSTMPSQVGMQDAQNDAKRTTGVRDRQGDSVNDSLAPRHDFPLLDEVTYLNAASMGLVPRPVQEQAAAFDRELALREQPGSTKRRLVSWIGRETRPQDFSTPALRPSRSRRAQPRHSARRHGGCGRPKAPTSSRSTWSFRASPTPGSASRRRRARTRLAPAKDDPASLRSIPSRPWSMIRRRSSASAMFSSPPGIVSRSMNWHVSPTPTTRRW